MANNRTQETEEMLDDALGKIAELIDRLADVEYEQRHLKIRVRFLEKLLKVEGD